MGVMLKYAKTDGTVGEIDAGVEIYKAAAAAKMDLRQYMRTQAVDCDYSIGDPIDQMMSSAGLHDSHPNAQFKMPALTMADLAGMTQAEGFRRPDGSDNSLGARLLYPQMILETLVADARVDDGFDIVNVWESMIAVDRNLNGQRADQPIIDTRGPDKSRSGRITQLAEPETMVSITVGEKSYRIPTSSIGLLIADEAMEATTIDLVRVVMAKQARGERIARAMEQLKSMVLGDEDLGMAALPVLKAGDFDPAITTDGTITKRAYIKWLHSVQKTASITRILTDIDSAIDVDEGLAPRNTGVDNSKIVTPWGGANLAIPQPTIVPVEADVFGAGLLVGLDPSAAIQRFTNVAAAYDAIEKYVMRKATGFRVDFGEMAVRLYDDAWSVLSLEKA